MPIAVTNDGIPAHAVRLSGAPVRRGDLALSFAESSASSVEVLVEGKAFYPPMLADVAAATSSVHINQFGFRPGVVGDAFADALVAKAGEGVPVRLVVDRQGSDPEGGSRAFYERLAAAGVEVCVVRATKVRSAAGTLGSDGAPAWNIGGLGHIDHRKVAVIDGRIGWVGGAGIEDHFEDGRFHDLFVRVEGPVVAQLALVFVAGYRWLGGTIPAAEVDVLFPPLDPGPDPVPAVVLHNAPGSYRPITDAIARLLDEARTTLDVVNPYVTDRRMIRRIEQAARRGVRVRLFVPRTRTTGPAPRRSSSTTRSCSTRAFASSSTRRCCTPRRSCATGRNSSRGRATSRPGASGGSSRSTSASARRRSPRSSTSGSRRRPRSCRRRGVR